MARVRIADRDLDASAQCGLLSARARSRSQRRESRPTALVTPCGARVPWVCTHVGQLDVSVGRRAERCSSESGALGRATPGSDRQAPAAVAARPRSDARRRKCGGRMDWSSRDIESRGSPRRERSASSAMPAGHSTRPPITGPPALRRISSEVIYAGAAYGRRRDRPEQPVRHSPAAKPGWRPHAVTSSYGGRS